MALDRKNLIALAKVVGSAKRSAPVAYSFEGKEFSYSALNETLRSELNILSGTYNMYRRNKNDIFEIMQEVIDEVLPVRIFAKYGEFAEIKQYGQGNKPSFSQKTGKKRAKQFITKVGLAGIYEVFKLDKEFFTVEATAFGGAAQIGLEEFLDGVVDFAELLDVIIEGLDEAFYAEIAKALETLYTTLPASNKGEANGFSATVLDDLISKASSYGVPTIMATLELAAKIVPAANWISDEDKTEMRNKGFIGIYKGTKVVVLPQSYEDETLATKVIAPEFAYILITDGKPAKVALEGEAIVDEFVNADRSREIQTYKKFGVALVTSNDMFVYKDLDLV